jgi:fibrillarin-like pre-rRNA processing protein
MRILYLGAAHGTTVSHIDDYVDVVYAVEFAPRPMRDLIEVARVRGNIVPIMADALDPDHYACLLEEVDLIYQDIAQPKQAEIAVKNSIFLKKEGVLVMMLKTRSVDVTQSPETVLKATILSLEQHYNIVDALWLVPYHRDHAAILCEAIK